MDGNALPFAERVKKARRPPEERNAARDAGKEILAARERFNGLLVEALEQMEMSSDELRATLHAHNLRYGQDGLFIKRYGILRLMGGLSEVEAAKSVEGICQLVKNWSHKHRSQWIEAGPLRSSGMQGVRGLKEKSR